MERLVFSKPEPKLRKKYLGQITKKYNTDFNSAILKSGYFSNFGKTKWERIITLLEENRQQTEKQYGQRYQNIINAFYGLPRNCYAQTLLGDLERSKFYSIFGTEKFEAIKSLSAWQSNIVRTIEQLNQTNNGFLMIRFWDEFENTVSAQNQVIREQYPPKLMSSKIRKGVISEYVVKKILQELGAQVYFSSPEQDAGQGIDYFLAGGNSTVFCAQIKSHGDIGYFYISNPATTQIHLNHNNYSSYKKLIDFCQNEKPGFGLNYHPLWISFTSNGSQQINQYTGQINPDYFQQYQKNEKGKLIRELLA